MNERDEQARARANADPTTGLVPPAGDSPGNDAWQRAMQQLQEQRGR